MTERPVRGFSLAAVARSAAILTAASVLVQVVGIVRELYLAAEVGVSPRLDALIVGIALPTMLANVFTAGPRTALVPAYMEMRDTRDLRDARRVAGTVLVWTLLIGLLITAALALLAEPLIALTGPGLDEGAEAAAVGYLRLVSPVALLMGLTAVLMAVCQAEELFALIAVATVLNPVLAVLVMFVLWDPLGLDALALGILVGAAASLAVFIAIMIPRGIAPRPALSGRGLGLGDFVRHAAPLTVSSLILQGNRIFDRAIATLVAPGAVSVLRFGDSLLRAPIGAIGPAWSNAMYPAMVSAARRSGDEGIGPAAERTLRYTIAVFVPVGFLSAAVAPIATSVVYGRGEFGPDDVAAVAPVLAAFAPLVFLITMDGVLTSALNARRRGLALLGAGALNVALNAFFDVVLGFTLGVVGIALASTVTAAIVTTWKARRFVRGETGVQLSAVGRMLALTGLAALPGSLVVGVVAWNVGAVEDTLVGLAALAVGGAVGIASYLAFSMLLGLAEPRRLAVYGLQRLRGMRP